jgi:HD superfamily phosphodiesterase
MDELASLGKVGPLAGPAAAELLERLGRHLPAARPQAPVRDADELRAAVAEADASFTTAMDLRRQLEEAFQKHLR